MCLNKFIFIYTNLHQIHTRNKQIMPKPKTAEANENRVFRFVSAFKSRYICIIQEAVRQSFSNKFETLRLPFTIFAT